IFISGKSASFACIKSKPKGIIIVHLHDGRVHVLHRKVVKEHLQRLLVVVGEVNVRISRLLHNDLLAKFFVRHIGAVFLGGSGHGNEGTVHKGQVLVEEQDVQVSTGARVPRLGRVQKPCKGETVPTAGRDG